MGNKLVCKECDKNHKKYEIKLSYCSKTELYTIPINILGITYIPKANTKTYYYKCSNGHSFEKYEKCE